MPGGAPAPGGKQIGDPVTQDRLCAGGFVRSLHPWSLLRYQEGPALWVQEECKQVGAVSTGVSELGRGWT